MFRNNKAFLSNMFPCNFTINNITFNCAEQAYVYNKCYSSNPKINASILACKNGYEAKKLGKILPIRPNFLDDRLRVMKVILDAKFSIKPLASKLLQVSDNELIEFNYWHDNYWGYCTCTQCKNKIHHNHLGELLKQIKLNLSF